MSDLRIDDDEPEWMLEHARKEKRDKAARGKREFELRLARIRAKERAAKERFQNAERNPKRKVPRRKRYIPVSASFFFLPGPYLFSPSN